MTQLNRLTLVVVTGCQRSGTTLLGQMIGAHPSAFLVDEPDVYPLLDSILQQSADSEQLLRETVQSVCKQYRNKDRCDIDGVLLPTVTHLVFKAPNAVFEYATFRELSASQFKFVFAVRDARDVVASMARLSHIKMVENQTRWFGKSSAKTQARHEQQFALTQDSSLSLPVRRAHMWAVKTGLFKEFCAPPLNGIRVDYHALVASPSVIRAEVLQYCGLVAEDARDHETEFLGLGPGFTARQRPVDSSSVARWKHSLSAVDEEQVWNIAAPLMQELGYSRGLMPSIEIRENDSKLLGPVIVLGRGGSGTRLLSKLIQELGVHLGSELNGAEDSMEWVDIVYELALRKLRGDSYSNSYARETLLKRAEVVVARAPNEGAPWGMKLPEAMLVIPELRLAFPNAKFIHLVRDPVDTCMRRTHKTSRLDNPVGAAVLRCAYAKLGFKHHPASDPDHVKNAISWEYQVSQALDQCADLSDQQHMLVRYEDLCEQPQIQADRVARFLGCAPRHTGIGAIIEESRRRQWQDGDERVSDVNQICGGTAERLGYRPAR
ncbi:sulfotransferase [Pseudomarimonas arenosa]|uniref:Sulfotransferase n=1 Tax=Pseudomarimonas arenosa TaxID=2774145 RepID=A0AAW3ZK90_9GAMM|nr:sulfotransferase [Pseudomarimonas arenosa]MBD8524876.1 sulfotransferase [Pseudomarimonas arenosa]